MLSLGYDGLHKGKAAYRYEKLEKQYRWRHLWSQGYCVSGVGLDEEKIRK